VTHTLPRALVLAALGAAIGVAANAARRDGIRPASFAPAATCEGQSPAPALISPAEAASLCGRPDVVIADARTPARFAEGHVAGAVHLPCQGDTQATVLALDRLRGHHTVIVYGDSTGEAQAVAASIVHRQPTLDVRVLAGGFPAWSQAGQACASGPCESCDEPSLPAALPATTTAAPP